jgi:hypothetical protein
MRCLAELVILVGVTDSTVAERVPAARRYPDPVHLVPPGPIAERVVATADGGRLAMGFLLVLTTNGDEPNIASAGPGTMLLTWTCITTTRKGRSKTERPSLTLSCHDAELWCSNAGHSFGYHLIRGVLEFRQSGQGKVHQTGRGRLQGRRGPGNLSSSLNGKPPP